MSGCLFYPDYLLSANVNTFTSDNNNVCALEVYFKLPQSYLSAVSSTINTAMNFNKDWVGWV